MKHPMLFFSEKDIPTLRSKAESSSRGVFGISGMDLWKVIKRKADEYCDEQYLTIKYPTKTLKFKLPISQPRGSKYYGHMPDYNIIKVYPYWTRLCRSIAERIELLSFVFIISENKRFLEKAKEYIFSVCKWKEWTDPDYNCRGKTCLDTCSLAFSISFALDTLYGHLSECEKELIIDALYEKAMKPLSHDLKSETLIDVNVVSDRIGALGLASLVTSDYVDTEEYLNLAVTKTLWYLDQRIVSGHTEGLGYDMFSLSCLLKFLYPLKRVKGLDMFRHPCISKMLKWAIYFMVPGGKGSVNFCDCHYTYKPILPIAIIARVLKDPLAYWYLKNNLTLSASSPLLFILIDTNLRVEEVELPKAKAFFDIGWVSIRTGWRSSDVLFALRCGSFWSHQHRDQNNFVLNIAGEWFVYDPGYKSYNKKLNEYTEGTVGHNTIMVNGIGQVCEPEGLLKEFIYSGSVIYAIGDASNAYPKETKLLTFLRKVMLVDSEYFIMIDELKASESVTFQWLLHLNPLSKIKIKEREVSEALNGKELVIKFVLPTNTRVSLKDSPDVVRYGKYVVCECEASKCNFVTSFIPVISEKSKKNFEFVTINESLVRVRRDDVEDVLMIDGSHYKDISSNAKVALLSYREGELFRYFIDCGNELRHDESVLLKSSREICAVYTEDNHGVSLTLRCQCPTYIKVYIPKFKDVKSIKGSVDEFFYSSHDRFLRFRASTGVHRLTIHAK